MHYTTLIKLTNGHKMWQFIECTTEKGGYFSILKIFCISEIFLIFKLNIKTFYTNNTI